jgi:hypothetical protein
MLQPAGFGLSDAARRHRNSEYRCPAKPTERTAVAFVVSTVEGLWVAWRHYRGRDVAAGWADEVGPVIDSWCPDCGRVLHVNLDTRAVTLSH